MAGFLLMVTGTPVRHAHRPRLAVPVPVSGSTLVGRAVTVQRFPVLPFGAAGQLAPGAPRRGPARGRFGPGSGGRGLGLHWHVAHCQPPQAGSERLCGSAGASGPGPAPGSGCCPGEPTSRPGVLSRPGPARALCTAPTTLACTTGLASQLSARLGGFAESLTRWRKAPNECPRRC